MEKSSAQFFLGSRQNRSYFTRWSGGRAAVVGGWQGRLSDFEQVGAVNVTWLLHGMFFASFRGVVRGVKTASTSSRGSLFQRASGERMQRTLLKSFGLIIKINPLSASRLVSVFACVPGAGANHDAICTLLQKVMAVSKSAQESHLGAAVSPAEVRCRPLSVS